MIIKRIKLGLAALFAGFALVVSAVTRDLPTPPPSDYADTESSICVPLSDWPDLGRRIALTLTAHTTPSNCVQIAFGQDTNGDEDLEPEETVLRIGVDCGEPFVCDEVEVEGRGRQWNVQVSSVEAEQEGDHLCSPLAFTFTLKQPLNQAARFSFAKVTTRGRDETAAEIAAEITRPGVMLLLR